LRETTKKMVGVRKWLLCPRPPKGAEALCSWKVSSPAWRRMYAILVTQKNILLLLFIFGHVVEQFPIENRPGAVLSLATRGPNVKTDKMQ
jgi:hypothetical protein